MIKLKLAAGLLVLIVIMIFGIQNARMMEISFLFWSLEMSWSLALLIGFSSGIILGILLSSIYHLKAR